MYTPNLLSALTLVALGVAPLATTAHPSSPPAMHRRSQRRSPSNFFANLWERRLPITATTTVTVDATSTQVVWVTATSYPGSAIPTAGPSANTSSDASSPTGSADWNATTTAIFSSSAVPTEANYTTSATEWWATASTSASESLVSPTVRPNATRTEGWIVIPTDAPITENATTSSHHYDPSSAAASEASASASYTEVSSASAPNATQVSSTAAGGTEVASVTEASSTAFVTASTSATPESSGALTSTREASEMTRPTSSLQSSSTGQSSQPGLSSASATSSELQPTSTGVTGTSSSSAQASASTDVVSASESVTTATIISSGTDTSTVPTGTSSTDSSSLVPVSTSARGSSSSVVEPTSTSAAASSSSSSTVVYQTSTTSSTAAIPSTTSGSSLSTTPLNDRIVAGYYPDWSVWTFPPSNLDFNRLDVVDFAFAIVNAQYGLEFTQYNSEDTLNWLVSVAHAAGKKVRLSIGGWTGSVYFSPAVATAQNRQVLAQAILGMYQKFNLDGIDLDWEYPGVKGADNNIVSSDDSANYLIFLRLLRKTLPPTAILSAATQVWPFAGPTGAPLSDVSEFAKLLDWVMVMNYDVWGSSSTTPGPNAPLSDGCGTSAQPLANAYAAVSSWTTAGMPAKQIVLGLPAYGYMQESSADSLRARKRRGVEKRGGVTLYNADGGTSYGQIKFSDMINQGGLVRDYSGHYIGAGGFTKYWDTCSSTPWLKSSESGQIITYDDPDSISLKAQFARQAGLRGANFWEITGDSSDWSLLDAARSGLGI